LTADQADELVVRERLLEKWLANPVAANLLDGEAQDLELELQRQVELIAVGLAGLARTLHVGANQGLFSEHQPTEAEILAIGGQSNLHDDGILTVFEEQDRRLSDIDRAHQVYSQLEIDTLPPWTIHHDGQDNHNPIDWRGETTQDQAQTHIKLGRTEDAVELVVSEIDRIDIKLTDTAFGDLRWDILDSDLKVLDYPVYRLRKRYLGLRSAKAVLHFRLAKAAQSVNHFQAALDELLDVQLVLPQPERLAVIAKHALKAVANPGMSGDLEDRVRLAITALPIVWASLRK
jgi:hypothetical protein